MVSATSKLQNANVKIKMGIQTISMEKIALCEVAKITVEINPVRTRLVSVSKISHSHTASVSRNKKEVETTVPKFSA